MKKKGIDLFIKLMERIHAQKKKKADTMHEIKGGLISLKHDGIITHQEAKKCEQFAAWLIDANEGAEFYEITPEKAAAFVSGNMSKYELDTFKSNFKGVKLARIDSLKKLNNKELVAYLNKAKQTSEDNRQHEKAAELVGILSAPDLKEFEIKTEWSKSRTWGPCPTAKGWIKNASEWEDMKQAHAGGWGYDKISTVYSEILTSSKSFKKAILKAILKDERATLPSSCEWLPYGVRFDHWGFCVNFAGCGVSTLRGICEYSKIKIITETGGASWDYIKAEAVA